MNRRRLGWRRGARASRVVHACPGVVVFRARATIGGTRLSGYAILHCTTALLTLLSACASAHRNPPPTQALPIPTEQELSRQPALVDAWAHRLKSDEPAVANDAGRHLVNGGQRSVPLLRRLLRTREDVVRSRAIESIAQIGPDAIGLLTEMLGDRRVSVRRAAIDILVDLAPETESIQPALCRALNDEDAVVARDAARAIGALGERAAPSTPSLADALSHADPHVRLYAAEALASIGPVAAQVTPRLIAVLDDPSPGVRWAACEALAGIGPAAVGAVPRLIESLRDESLYVRICAAGALGGIGPKASAAIDALKDAVANDPDVQAEARWALGRISGERLTAHAAEVPTTAGLHPTTRPAAQAPPTGNPPSGWDTETGRNIVWSVELGGDTLGRPVVAGGNVYVGTDNARKLNPAFTDPCGVLMAFRASDGGFLWQDLAPRVANRGTGQFLLPSTTSAPYVDGERLYYVTAECQLRCLDARSGRVVWELDMCARLGVFPHEASNSDVLPVGGLLVVCTSNGLNEGHTRVPSPRAPSLIAVDKRTGKVVWRATAAGENILHGEWCSPVAVDVAGRTQILFGGGDGWLRAYDPETGREIWRFDGNPKDARRLPRHGVLSRNPIVASPVYEDGRVFIAMGDDPTHGNGPSLVHAISPNGQGDVTESRLLWTSRDVGRVVGTPVVKDGLLYVGDLGGTITCLDASTGALVWRHETEAAIWGCLTLAGDKLYVGNGDGVMTVLRAGRRKEVLARIEMDASLYARPAVVGDALYLATARRLYLIAAKP
jgi:outer membrane protein assembly factor BamB